MGKNRIIKSLGNILGNIAVHKLLIKYTNKPESVSHLHKEVGVYGENASEIAQEFNWNDKDRLKISEEALKKFKHNMAKYYSDVIFQENEASDLIGQVIDELFDY